MRRLASVWGAALLICLLAWSAAAEELDYLNRLYGMLHSADGESDVNVRENPSMDASLVGTYRSGVNAEAIGRKDGWLQVEIGEEGGIVRGYVLEKYFANLSDAEHARGFPVMRLSDARDAWDFAAQPEERMPAGACRREDGTLELGGSGWPQLAAGTLCAALGETEDSQGEMWTHVQIGLDCAGFVKTQALEETGLVTISDVRLPRAGIAVAHPETPYAMPVYRYADDSQAHGTTLKAGDTLEYIADLGEWTQVSGEGYAECAFVPTRYLNLYAYADLFSVGGVLEEGAHVIENAGLYTFSCVGSGRMEIDCGAYRRTYEGNGMYSMYLPSGARVSILGGSLCPVSRDERIEDLSENGIGAWDESNENGRYLAGVQLVVQYWRDANYVVTAAEGKECGYYRIETIDQDAGAAPQSEWIQIGAQEVVQVELYHGQFIELKDAELSYFSGNG